ncbi:MAG TPA: ECF-type sigma factor [Steroidobacteraceae bacterium]|nr:ECF-type sigma factor [Steroidobacteraceae bacterium]
MSELGIERLLQAAAAQDAAAREQLFSVLYDELHRLAQSELRRHGQSLTLSPTTILHEAYLELSRREGAVFPDRSHFMAYAARAMRGLIIDYARQRCAQKRGGGFQITSLASADAEHVPDATNLERVADAVDALGELEPRLADVVNLKFFCGFSFVEIAAMQGVSERTVQRDWEKARMLLYESVVKP